MEPTHSHSEDLVTIHSNGYCNCFFDSDVTDDVLGKVKSSCSAAKSEYTGRGIGEIAG